MHALILAATLVATPQNPGQATRDIVIGVCLPFVASGEASADNIALADLQLQPGDEQAFQTGDGRHLVELSTRGDAEEGTDEQVGAGHRALAGGLRDPDLQFAATEHHDLAELRRLAAVRRGGGDRLRLGRGGLSRAQRRQGEDGRHGRSAQEFLLH